MLYHGEPNQRCRRRHRASSRRNIEAYRSIKEGTQVSNYLPATGTNVGKINLAIYGHSLVNGLGPALDAIVDHNDYNVVPYVSHPGYTMEQMLPTTQEDLLSMYDETVSRNILIIDVDKNNFNNGIALSTSQAQLATICGIARDVGFTVVTVIGSYGNSPYSPGGYVGWSSWVAWMLQPSTLASLHAEAVVNIYADPVMGSNAYNGGDPNYYAGGGGDPLHPSALGYAYYAGLLYAGVQSIVNVVRTIPATPTSITYSGGNLNATFASGVNTTTDVQYTYNKGFSLVNATGVPISFPYVRLAGMLKLRTRAKGVNPPSLWLSYTPAITSGGDIPVERIYSADERMIYNAFHNGNWWVNKNGGGVPTWDQVAIRFPYLKAGFRLEYSNNAYGGTNWEVRVKNVGDADSASVVVATGINQSSNPNNVMVDLPDLTGFGFNPNTVKELMFYPLDGAWMRPELFVYGA